MSTTTSVSTNMILKSTEQDLREEAIDDTLWGPLMVDNAAENGYNKDKVPDGVVERKTKKLKRNAKYIECGTVLELEGEEKTNGETLIGNEEPLQNLESRVYFTDLRHGVPFDLKGINAWTTEAFADLTKAQKRLSTWHKRVWETWMWQAFFKGTPDKVAAAFGATEAKQSWHPNIFTAESGGLSQVTWSGNNATYQTAVDAAMDALAAGDTISIDTIYDIEVACANLKIPMVKCKGKEGGKGWEDMCWIWAYPRTSRKRIKKLLDTKTLYGDVRGPSNRSLTGDIYKFGKFLFVEAAYIPRMKQVSNVLSLEEAWAFDRNTNKRVDNRANLQGVAHAILGEGAMWMVEPESLQYDTEYSDYKRKQGIGTYRMVGSKRAETYDDYSAAVPTKIRCQGSLVIIEHATTV